MNDVILKYPAGHAVQIPRGARVVKAGVQGGEHYFWAKVSSLEESEKRDFFVVGTGQLFEGNYVTTYFEGPFVWHLIERVGPGHKKDLATEKLQAAHGKE